jgi:hypothetical protein
MSREPLHYEELLDIQNSLREELIIKRANFFTQLNYPPGVDHNAYSAAIEDARGRFMYSEFKSHEEFPHQ